MVTAANIETVRQAYFDNADFLESASVEKARAFATACRRLLMFTPSRSRAGGANGNEMWIDIASVKAQLDEVVKWLRINDSGNSMAGQTIHHGAGLDYRGGGGIGRDFGTYSVPL
jgi:hypothetical protein